MDLLQYEKELYSKGIKYIGGTDEAGRGPLYGPVVAACVYLPEGFKLEGLTDSKKLSEKKRNLFYDYIIKNAIYGVSAKEIDEINIYEASRKAMIIAINKVKDKIPLEYVLSDAMPMEIDIPVMPIIKGDAKSLSIAAASVIAKVTRDKMMYEADQKYPMYGFKNHKGYPTKRHLELIKKYGVTDDYRFTYKPVCDLIYVGGANEVTNK